MMKNLAVVIAIAACGAKQPSTETARGAGDGGGSATPVVADTRTPFEQRRDTACKALAPKLTACAVEDAKADLATGKVKQAQFDQDTSSQVQTKNTELFMEKCTGWRDMSSRQVRVLEVCFKEESQCGPLRECLTHLEGQAK